MDSLSETAKDTSKETLGFFKYVFGFIVFYVYPKMFIKFNHSLMFVADST